MDRLTVDTKIIFCDIAQCSETPYGGSCENGYCDQRKCYEKLREYELTGRTPQDIAEWVNAESEGRLVVLPCKVGDTVYEPNKRGFISTHHITSIILTSGSIYYKSELISGVYINTSEFDENAIGKTIFLTQAEAEKTLAEMEVNNDNR